MRKGPRNSIQRFFSRNRDSRVASAHVSPIELIESDEEDPVASSSTEHAVNPVDEGLRGNRFLRKREATTRDFAWSSTVEVISSDEEAPLAPSETEYGGSPADVASREILSRFTTNREVTAEDSAPTPSIELIHSEEETLLASSSTVRREDQPEERVGKRVSRFFSESCVSSPLERPSSEEEAPPTSSTSVQGEDQIAAGGKRKKSPEKLREASAASVQKAAEVQIKFSRIRLHRTSRLRAQPSDSLRRMLRVSEIERRHETVQTRKTSANESSRAGSETCRVFREIAR